AGPRTDTSGTRAPVPSSPALPDPLVSDGATGRMSNGRSAGCAWHATAIAAISMHASHIHFRTPPVQHGALPGSYTCVGSSCSAVVNEAFLTKMLTTVVTSKSCSFV